MLIKDICQKCREEYKDFEPSWSSEADEIWAVAGMIVCPSKAYHLGKGFQKSLAASVSEKPPNWCPYRLEHMIMEQENGS